MRSAPALVPALALLLGILAEAHGFAFPFAALAFAVACFRRDAAVALTAGLVLGRLHGHPAVVERELPTARYAGVVTGDVRAGDATFVTFPLTISGIGTLRASANSAVRAGERLRVRGRIAPFDEPRNPGEPSARAIAIDDGFVGELHVERVLVRQPPDLHDLRVWMPVARARASAILRTFVAEPAASIVAGALWGERGTLPSAIRDDFQATGTVHILVTAGLHLGVIAALIAWLCSRIGMPRIAAALAAIPVVYLYAWFSGWHLPSQRAAAMIAIALLARACGARTVTLNTLAVAAIVVAAAWPVCVESVSFALSFSCVAAIVLFAESITAFLRARRVPESLAEALALTTATQIGVWPLTAATFFTLAPYAMLANAVIVPLVGTIMLGGLAIIALDPIPQAAGIIARWESWLVTGALFTTHTLAALPGGHLRIAPPPAWAIVAYDAAAIVAAWFRRRARIACAILTVASIGVFIAAIPHAPGALTITVLDVGQGDAIVIRTPRGHTIMIDTGGRLERGATIDGHSPAERAADRIVLPYLLRAGISRIDLLVLTHPHGDHVGGFAGIVDGFDVGEIFDSGQQYGGRAYNDGLREAAVHHVPIHIARCGDRWSSDDSVQIDVLSPCGRLLAAGKNDVNENSIVAMLHSGSFRVLFTGDSGFETERRLLARDIDLHADILKIGHHGSAYATSAEFIEAVRPRLALISVGRHNLFGHPAPSTIATIESANAKACRTDTCGAITLFISKDVRLSTMLACKR